MGEVPGESEGGDRSPYRDAPGGGHRPSRGVPDANGVNCVSLVDTNGTNGHEFVGHHERFGWRRI